MTTEHHASRTLVKSPPELWAECSDAASLARHIGEFGEIRITRLEPETSIGWEGELVTGTVTIEPSGWGTRVTLTVQTAAEDIAEAEAEGEALPQDGDHVVAQAEEQEMLDQLAGEEPAEPQIIETEPVKEDVDEKVEATLAEPDPALATDPDPVGGRWKRLIKRTRAWFNPPEGEQEPGREDEREPEMESVPPPEAESASVPPPGPADVAPAAVAAEEVVVEDLIVEDGAVEEPAPEAVPEVQEPGPEATAEPAPFSDPDAILVAALDSLGQAHHRPFSRA